MRCQLLQDVRACIVAGRRAAVPAMVVAVAAIGVAGRGEAAAPPLPLARGCNQIVSAFPDGTLPATLAAAVTPAGVVLAIWRWEGGGRIAGWAPDSGAPVNLLAVNRLDALWLCVRAPAQLQQPDAGANGSGPVLRCTARSLPVGRAAAVWTVECSLSGAPAADTSFAVTAFTPDGQPVCEAPLEAGGAGRCGGTLSVPLDSDNASLPLRFYARVRPSGATAVDASPAIQAGRP